MNIKEKLDTAKARMIISAPFFGSLVCRLTFEEVPADKVAFFACDGKKFLYSAEAVEATPTHELATAMAQAALYCVLHHPTRRDNRTPEKYQLACLHEVDEILKKSFDEAKSANRPLPWRWPDSHPPFCVPEWAGKVAEQIYRLIPDPSPGDNPPLCEVLDNEKTEPTEIEEEEAKWDVALDQAIAVAQAQGTLPGSLALLAEKSVPKLPWTHHLKPFVSQFAKEDYSFARPQMGVFAESDGEIILPSLYSEAIGPIVVAIDTSGSIYGSRGLLDEFLAEIESIHRECAPRELHFIDCDARVYSHRVFAPGDQLDLSLRGGGGTRFEPVFEFVAQNRIEPDCLIYFTDMHGSFPPPPAYPTLWVSYSYVTKAPFGSVIQAK